MIVAFLRVVRFSATTIFLVVLTSCQVMDSSVSYEVRPDGSQVRRCNSGFGSYALPYSTITATVYQQYQGGVKVDRPMLKVSAPEAHPDPKHIYCLDFLENAFSDDDVTVAYYRKGDTSTIDTTQDVTGLLSVVASKNIDQTGEIIRNLIRAIFIFVSGDSGFSFNRLTGTSERVMMTEQTVDPFDLSAMAALNKSLHEYGYCLTLGKYTFDTGRFSPESYCNSPDLSLSAAAAPPFLRAAKDQHNLVGTLPVGVFYRPRQPYQLSVYVRDDPDSGKPWELRMTKEVMLENLSPILALRVNRTIFAEYRTALAFDRGNLIDVCIAKGSEVLGGLQIPLDIVYGLVSLPAATIRKEIELKTTTTTLLSRQRQILALQNQILQAKAGEFPGANPNVTAVSLGPNDLGFGSTAPLQPSYGKVSDAQFGDFCKLIKGS